MRTALDIGIRIDIHFSLHIPNVSTPMSLFQNVYCYLFLYSYVSRISPKNSTTHVTLGTQQLKPAEFGSQINLNMDNAWGILRCIIDTCLKLPEGKYLIMKDPNKVKTTVIIKLYPYRICINDFDEFCILLSEDKVVHSLLWLHCFADPG